MERYLKLIFIALVLAGITASFISREKLVTQAAPVYADGTLIKAANDPNIYIINNNVKVWVRSAEVFNNCGYNWNNLTNVASLDAVSTADLIKKADNPDVYRLEKDFKRKLASIEIFNSYGLDWNKIAVVCPAVLSSYSQAPLVQASGSNDIYKIDTDFIRHRYLGWDSFVNDGKQMRDVIVVNTAEFGSFSEGEAVGGASVPVEPPASAPVAPVLNDPGTIVASATSFSVSWSAPANATSYTLERAKSASFADAAVIYSGTAASVSESLNPTISTFYFYRVKAQNSAGSSPWSNVVDIQVIAGSCSLPALPNLSISANALVATSAYNLSWPAVSGATGYELQRATNDNFTNASIAYSGSATTVSQNPNPAVTTTYYYRIRASNSCGIGLWSNTVSILLSTAVPAAPVLNDPGTSTLKGANFGLGWSAAVGANAYTLEVAATNDFAVVLATHNLDNVLTKDYSHGTCGTFYYRVRASNASGLSPWSNVVDLQVNEACPLPVAPVLIDPGNQQLTNAAYFLTWNAVSGATSYTWQSDIDTNFSNPSSHNVGNTDNVTAIATLANTYYFRVKATNNCGDSPWSNLVDLVVKVPTYDVPADYATIQTAIDAAPSGQTVNVAGGTYYEYLTLKNGVNLKGAGPTQTIIDGSNTGQPIYASGVTATVEGLTVRNSSYYGMQLWTSSQVTVKNCIVRNNPHGIGFSGGANTVQNNLIINNTSWGLADGSGNHQIINNTIYGNGTGYYVGNTPFPTLKNNIIVANGIGVDDSGAGVASLQYNDVWNNTTNYKSTVAGAHDISQDPKFVNAAGADFHLQSSSLCIDAGDPASAYSNEPSPNGGRINLGAYGNTSEAQTTPPNDVPSVYATIQAAINAASSGKTIVVAAGTYQENITMKNGVNLKGAGAATTIIDGSAGGGSSTVYASGVTATIEGFSLIGSSSGYGLQLWGSSQVTAKNNIIRNNSRGVGFSGGANIIKNNIIRDNTGWGIAVGSGLNTVVNNVLYHNSSGFYTGNTAGQILKNNIITNNTSWGIESMGASVVQSYNDIWNNPQNYAMAATDISQDPKFVNAAAADFHLQVASPCKNTGDANAAYNDTDGSRNDMGAYGGPDGNW